MDRFNNTFFYRNWALFYLLLFLLIGLLMYALWWNPNRKVSLLMQQLENCKNVVPAATPPAAAPETVHCDARVESGGQGTTTTQHDLGNKTGKVTLQFDTVKIPDEIKVYYDGRIVAQTNGLVTGTGILEWNYTAQAGKPEFCVVEVSAPTESTVWEYIVNCPEAN
ncbi:hypothetical protein [Sphingobacterium sp. MYb382]|uniref:hypothetical protein n=1 Tax=Sphingobacterium sp. MYb382 TaxID=2745278 RepID=UPI0030B0E9D8